MKILFLTHFLPNSERTSNKIRFFYWLKYLGSMHEITLISFIETQEEGKYINELKKYCKSVITVLRMPKRGPWYRFINLFESSPYFIVKQFEDVRMRDVVEKTLKEETFDLIHVYSIAMAGYVYEIKGVRKILDATDSLTRNYMQIWHGRVNLRTRIFSFIDWTKIRYYETRMFLAFDRSFLVNPVDREFMLKINSRSVIDLIPIGVDLEHYFPAKAQEEPLSLVFTGTLNYIPNNDAVRYFLSEIFPLIEKRFPEIKFYIVGESGEGIRKFARNKKNVIFTGFVKDVRQMLLKAAVFVCPLRMGTGVKTKVLEAMAMARPVVISKVGIEGIDAKDGEDVLVADEPEKFFEAVIRFLENKELRMNMGLKARKIVERCHSPQLLASKVDSIYRELTGK